MIRLSVAKLDEQLCFALYSASSHVTGIYRPLLDEFDITYTQFLVLMALWEEDNVSISQLAKKAGQTKATMTPLMKRLENKGLIERKILENNERQKNIVLTKKGHELSTHSLEMTNTAFCETGLTKQQAGELINLCNRITENNKK